MNLVLIVTDDMRWDLIDAAMPKLKASILTGEAVQFTNAFAVNPVCMSARVTMLTGNYPRTTGIYGNNPPVGGFEMWRDGPDADTLPVHLQSTGYTTALIGKYLNGYNPDDAEYVAPGWDTWWAITGEGGNYFGYSVSDDGALVTYGEQPEDYLTDVIAARADDFLATAPEPFFAMITPVSPHQKAVPAPRHVGSFDGLPPWRPKSHNETDVKDKPEWVRKRAQYDKAGVAALDALRLNMHRTMLGADDLVERVIISLMNRGVMEDTLVIFTSDNGYLWGEHRLDGKSVPYLEATRAPFVVWGASAANKDALISNLDVAPTLSTSAGLSMMGEGRDLSGTFMGADEGPAAIICEHHAMAKIPAWVICQRRRRSYTFYGSGEEEFYNLTNDPLQLSNKVEGMVVTTNVDQDRAVVREWLKGGGPPGMEVTP